MPIEQAVDLGRITMKEVFLVGSPILALAIVVSLLINIVQVLTSLQEATISSVPRLLAVGAGTFLLMPWMWRQLCQFTVQLLSDFHPYLR
ncbi:MAG TPA: flagellar biosynthetic protein FliQ [Terriglobales bacterium]|jgi:flagellar biosynthesis protein FliQ|nr:flagellar biosynthetic protein FliQ [Terriglobales bacterium]